MTHTTLVTEYLDLLEAQREEIFAELRGIDSSCIWQRPSPGEWCIGENLAHSTAVSQSFRRLIQVAFVILAPIGYLRRKQPFHPDIDDVYARSNFPLKAGILWPPKFTPEHPVNLDILFTLVADEHRHVRNFYLSKDVDILGNTPLYDPAIGWLNLIQALRVGVYHDAHHFVSIRRILAGF